MIPLIQFDDLNHRISSSITVIYFQMNKKHIVKLFTSDENKMTNQPIYALNKTQFIAILAE